jgi:hypothetical protein
MARAREHGTDGVRAWVARLVEGVLPAADGGPPPVVQSGKLLLRAFLATVVGLVVGASVGLLVALLLAKVPDVSWVLLVFLAGGLVGAFGALAMFARARGVAKFGAWALFLTPFALALAPLLLLVVLVLALRGRKPRRR